MTFAEFIDLSVTVHSFPEYLPINSDCFHSFECDVEYSLPPPPQLLLPSSLLIKLLNSSPCAKIKSLFSHFNFIDQCSVRSFAIFLSHFANKFNWRNTSENILSLGKMTKKEQKFLSFSPKILIQLIIIIDFARFCGAIHSRK